MAAPIVRGLLGQCKALLILARGGGERRRGARASGRARARADAQSLYKDDGSTLDDLCEAVATLEETARIARRVLGGAHPSTTVIEASLQNSRATLRARETPSPAESA